MLWLNDSSGESEKCGNCAMFCLIQRNFSVNSPAVKKALINQGLFFFCCPVTFVAICLNPMFLGVRQEGLYP